MSKPRFKFSNLRQLLFDLGFKEVPVKEPHIGFQHDKANLLLVFPPHRANSVAAPHHLVYTRMMLDGKGLLDAEEFDRIVGNSPTQRSASS